MWLVQKIKDLFLEPDLPQEFIDKWKSESEEVDRLKCETDRLKQISDLMAKEEISSSEKQRLDALHKQARTQLKKKETKKSVSYTF
jgi:hypothetical protein